jgi:hypothetical protein
MSCCVVLRSARSCLTSATLFDASLDEHHWLGYRLAGRTMRYVATGEDGRWLALLGFGGGALSCKPRDEYIGWSREQQYRRLPRIANNQRFVLPAGRHRNLASFVLIRDPPWV